jgi:hypothetical protein
MVFDVIPWWTLLGVILLVWSLWALACASAVAVHNARDPLPNGQQRGFSCAPVVPIFPLALWGIALLIDLVAEPWGTWIIGVLHGVLAVAFLGSIARDLCRLKLLHRQK